jgi:thiol-disulfide isomerase/thioredoxin
LDPIHFLKASAMNFRFLFAAGASLACLAACSNIPPTANVNQSSPTTNVSLSLSDLEGRPLDLESDQAAGRKVVLVFWQTWCASCRREAPELIEAFQTYGDRMRFVGVISGGTDVVDPADILQTAKDWGLPYPQVQDTDLRLTRAFGIEGTPTILVLGLQARVLYRGAGIPPNWEAFL